MRRQYKGKKKVAWISTICILLLCAIFIFSSDVIVFNIATTYLSMFIQDSDEVILISKEINKTCETNMCKYYKAVKFMENIAQREDEGILERIFFIDNYPDNTIKHGNDCDGLAVLFIDILKNVGIEKTYFVAQPEHVCVMTIVDSNYKFWNCFPDRDILFTKRV